MLTTLVTDELPAAVRDDPLEMLLRASALDGIVQLVTDGRAGVVIVTEASGIHDILGATQKSLVKSTAEQPGLRRLFGEGILTSNGAQWRRHRQVIQPAFRASQLGWYTKLMIARASSLLDMLEDDETHDIGRAIKQLTMDVAVEALFGRDKKLDAEAVGLAVRAVVEEDARGINFPGAPTADAGDSARLVDRAIEFIDETVFSLIDAKSREPQHGNDLLADLVRRAATDSLMTDREVRDQAVTLLIAGYETTALGITWAVHLVAKHPKWLSTLQTQTDRVNDLSKVLDREPAELSLIDATVLEALRLRPPVWAIGRLAAEACQVGKRIFPQGTTFVIPPWALHRRSSLFSQPERFIPQRWMRRPEQELPAYSFMPFGAGPRSCIGGRFARREAAIFLALLAHRFDFLSTDDSCNPVRPQPLLNLHPSGPVMIYVHSRSRCNARSDG